MIGISCSVLEQVRSNPVSYGQVLANNGLRKGGGPPGMFQWFKLVARRVHIGDIDINEGIKELNTKFQAFQPTKQNKQRQEQLFRQFVAYMNAFEKEGFAFVDGEHNMKWDILPEQVRLTGKTPWVIGDDKDYYSYFLIQEPLDWRQELRFPLLQQYISEQIIDCDAAEMKLGTYCLATNQFDFNTYTKDEIDSTINETKGVFTKVYNEFLKHKR